MKKQTLPLRKYTLIKRSTKSLVPIVCVVCPKEIVKDQIYTAQRAHEKHIECDEAYKGA